MKAYRNLLMLSLAAVGMLLAGVAVRADTLTLTLDAPALSQNASGDNVFTFFGTISYTGADNTNDGGATENLSGDNIYVDFPATLDDTPYNTDSNVPLSLSPGGTSGDVELFTVTTPSYIQGSSNIYNGYFEITGGPSSSADDQLTTQAEGSFTVQVTPEPTSWLLVATGLAGMAATLRRRRGSIA